MADLDAFAASMVGVPFRDGGRDRAGLDCYGNVYLAHREVYGIHLPLLTAEYDARPSRALEDLVRREQSAHWVEVGAPAPGDVVVLRITGRPIHLGLVLNGRDMLHVHETIATCVESYRGSAWARRVDGFWRHADRA